jgi:hypothetical protein
MGGVMGVDKHCQAWRRLIVSTGGQRADLDGLILTNLRKFRPLSDFNVEIFRGFPLGAAFWISLTTA